MSRELWGKPFASKKLWSAGALAIARSRGSGTIPGSVLLGAVDAITIFFLIVPMALMNDGYVEMDRASIVRPKGFEVGKYYKMIFLKSSYLYIKSTRAMLDRIQLKSVSIMEIQKSE